MQATITRRNKPATIAVNVKVDEDWVDLIVHHDDIFYTNYCGYWARGMVYTKKLGWLVFEHGDEVRPPDKVPRQILKDWRDGLDLPERWHRLDRDTALLAFAEGVKLWGENWTNANDVDAHSYDEVIQRVFFKKPKYG